MASPYRSRSKASELGGLVRVHRASVDGRATWFYSALFGLALTIFFGAYALSKKDPTIREVGVVFLMGMGTFWAGREWLRLGGVELEIHDQGFVFLDEGATVTMAWNEVTQIEAHYVPGATNRGVADLTNLVAFVVTSKRGYRVSLPRELSDFWMLDDELEKRTGLKLKKVILPNLTHR